MIFFFYNFGIIDVDVYIPDSYYKYVSIFLKSSLNSINILVTECRSNPIVMYSNFKRDVF